MAIDGYILGLIPFILFRKEKLFSLSFERKIILLLIIANIFYILYAFNINNQRDQILKDLRPLLYLLSIALFLSIAIKERVTFSLSKIKTIALYAALSNAIWFLFSYLGVFDFNTEDLYLKNNSNRYLDLSTYFSIYFIIHFQYLISKKIITNNSFLRFVLILSFISLLVSNSRSLIITVLICIGLISIKNIKQAIYFLIFSVILISIFLIVSDLIGQDRIENSLNSEGLINQLTNRYSPAFDALNSMSFNNYIFGLGLGYYFEISWFEYRGMKTLNASIDSSYLTHFIKQGIFGLLTIFTSIKLLCTFRLYRIRKYFVFFWLIIFLIAAPLYQNALYGVVFYLMIVWNIQDLNFKEDS
tara:strand:- start:2034 stop:3110 length:1077 start_codon:yes stop_codon:yes gene_type:complete